MEIAARLRLVGAGMLAMLLLSVGIVVGAATVASAWRANKERGFPAGALESELEGLRRRERRTQERIVRGLKKRAAGAIRSGDTGARLELLLLSGGGQYGAFGAGVLEGWREVEDPTFRRPEFDLVTGVSAGALLGSAALVGDQEADSAAIENLFLSADARWGIDGMWSFMPWRSAVMSGKTLERSLQRHLPRPLIEQVAAAGDEGRRLLVMATNVDLGRPAVWDMTRIAQRSRGPGDDDARGVTAYRKRIRASASLAPIFPPVAIDGMLHVDGGASHLFFLGPAANLIEALADALKAQGVSERLVVRVWLIINSPVWPDKRGVARRWPATMLRATNLLMFAIGRTDLQRLSRSADELEERSPGLVEFRFLAVPRELDLPPKTILGRKAIERLRRRGRELGRRPDSWQTEVSDLL
jgi:hypothetical protein